MVLEFPFDYVRAHLLLGQAREALGDTAGACSAYQARPRSLGAGEAAQRDGGAGEGARGGARLRALIRSRARPVTF